MNTYNINYNTVKVKPNVYPLNRGNLQRFIRCNFPGSGWITKDCSNYTLNFGYRTIVFPPTWNLQNKSYQEWYDYIQEKLK